MKPESNNSERELRSKFDFSKAVRGRRTREYLAGHSITHLEGEPEAGEAVSSRKRAASGGKFILKKSSDGQFRFVLKAGNGETILQSELYKARSSALNGIESVKRNAQLDERYERKIDKSGHPRFNLKAGNHEIIGTSESYNSEVACEHGIASVKANAPVAPVVEERG
ncbi:MAG: YegP family protein [Acidobacteria bacterium]|nr:YegP family protein [Acidobacteriota bacterium]